MLFLKIIIGNIDKFIYGAVSQNYRDFLFAQDKKGQQMGATVYSEGGFFVVRSVYPRTLLCTLGYSFNVLFLCH